MVSKNKCLEIGKTKGFTGCNNLYLMSRFSKHPVRNLFCQRMMQVTNRF
jgi:hypothetical protein